MMNPSFDHYAAKETNRLFHPVEKYLQVDTLSFAYYPGSQISRQIFDVSQKIIEREKIGNWLQTTNWIMIGHNPVAINAHDISVDIEENIILFMIPQKTKFTKNDITFLVHHEFGHIMDFHSGRFFTTETDVIFDGNVIDNEKYLALIEDIETFDVVPNEVYRLYHTLPHELSANQYAVLNSGVVPDDASLKLSYDIAKETL